MAPSLWLAYVLTAAAATALPGPSSITVLAHGAAYGLPRAAVTACGINAAVLLMMVLSVVSVGTLFAEAPLGFAILQGIGLCVLVWVGIQMWRQPFDTMDSAPVVAKGPTGWQLFWRGFVVSASNPKALVFFFALFPQFTTLHAVHSSHVAALIAIWLAFEFSSLMVYAAGGARLATLLRSGQAQRGLYRACGSTLVAMAFLLVVLRGFDV